MLATDPDRAKLCPRRTGYHCYCQSKTASQQPVWVPKSLAGPPGGSAAAACKKWTTVPAVTEYNGRTIQSQYICRAKVSGQWAVGNRLAGADDVCVTYGAGTGFYSVCGIRPTGNYEILCERT